MIEPLYKPETWVIFKQDDEGGFGRVVGGTFGGDGWFYTIKGATSDGSLYTVLQGDITHTFENGSWLAPTHFGGKGSAYTDVNS